MCSVKCHNGRAYSPLRWQAKFTYPVLCLDPTWNLSNNRPEPCVTLLELTNPRAAFLLHGPISPMIKQGNVPWEAWVFCTLRLPCEVPNNTEHHYRISHSSSRDTGTSARVTVAELSLAQQLSRGLAWARRLAAWHARSEFRLAQLACLCGEVTWIIRCLSMWCSQLKRCVGIISRIIRFLIVAKSQLLHEFQHQVIITVTVLQAVTPLNM